MNELIGNASASHTSGESKSESQLVAWEKLIKSNENEILSNPSPKEQEILVKEGVVEEVAGLIEPSEVPAIEQENNSNPDKVNVINEVEFEPDSSDDNESVVSGSDEEEESNVEQDKKACLLKEKGDEFVSLGKWQDAISCYNEALKYRKTPILYGNRALCYMKTDRFSEAERDCSCAIELDSRYKRIYRRRAAVRLRLRNYYGCAQDLQDLIILSSHSPVDPNLKEEYKIIHPLGRFMFANSNYSEEEAFKMLEKSVLEKLCLKQQMAADGFKARQMWPNVVECLSMGIMVSPKSASLYAERGFANFKLKKFILSEKDYTTAIQLEPSNSTYYRLRADVRRLMDDAPGSETDLVKASEFSSPVETSSFDVNFRVNASQTEDVPTTQVREPEEENVISCKIPVEDVYSSGVDQLYDLSHLPEKIKLLFEAPISR